MNRTVVRFPTRLRWVAMLAAPPPPVWRGWRVVLMRANGRKLRHVAKEFRMCVGAACVLSRRAAEEDRLRRWAATLGYDRSRGPSRRTVVALARWMERAGVTDVWDLRLAEVLGRLIRGIGPTEMGLLRRAVVALQVVMMRRSEVRDAVGF